ncbi:hypothetical protein TNCV_1108491 [Trichonephila clavipes]|nr:hypothetical protein TNCV_1108491 [Trichonephila clavipes]
MRNLPWPGPMFTIATGVLKRDDNPSKTIKTLDDRLHETRKMLRWCLNVFEKIVAKNLNKSLRLHTFRRRRLRESISRKRSSVMVD